MEETRSMTRKQKIGLGIMLLCGLVALFVFIMLAIIELRNMPPMAATYNSLPNSREWLLLPPTSPIFW